MLEITVRTTTITLRVVGSKADRTYSNTPGNYDRLNRMLDNRSAKPTPRFDLHSSRIFIRGRIGSYTDNHPDAAWHSTVYWIHNNENLIDVGGVWYDERTDPQVIKVLEMARRAGLDARITITYTTGDSESGYVRFFNNGRRLLRLCHNTRSASGGVIWTEGIESIHYSNARLNPKDRPYLYKRGE